VDATSWFRTGHLGPLHLGMSAGAVEAIVGQPDRRADVAAGSYSKYGALQLFFGRNSRAAYARPR
jgi:hypothetical protein